ncbi:MAG: glycosyl transferase, group 1 [uncultured bacterium]|nr:MAG: glycosyl transferase, group 1 [uncultured bacterium]
MARIGIDARFFGPIGKGLGRYTQKLIENLEKIDRENEYFVFLRKENFEEYVPKSDNFKKVLADFRWYGIREQIWMPLLLNRYALDIMHFPHFNVPLLYRRPIVVTIHDLILLHFPTLRGSALSPLLYRLKFWAYKLTISSAIRRARKVITVSEFTKKDILNHYGEENDKVVVTYEAADDFCRISEKNQEEILEKYGIIKPYLLYVGNAYPHKNLERLVNVFGRINQTRPELNLVLVGKEDYFYARLKELVRKKNICNVIFPGYVPDQDLDMVYRNCVLYVFPSLYEGFGLPPLEAMSKGAPVLSSDHECMQEILGDSVFFCEAENEEALFRKIEAVLADDEARRKIVEKGYRKSNSYSWNKMATETLEIYKKIKR